MQREKESRVQAELNAANLERQVNVLQFVKNINQKLSRMEEDYQSSQSKVIKC